MERNILLEIWRKKVRVRTSVPDDLEVRLSSDTGVDQGMGEIIVEFARRVNYSLPEGQHFEDGSTEVDYFEIYANDIEEDE